LGSHKAAVLSGSIDQRTWIGSLAHGERNNKAPLPQATHKGYLINWFFNRLCLCLRCCLCIIIKGFSLGDSHWDGKETGALRDAERSAGKSAYGTGSLTEYGTGSAAFASVALALASATSASNALAFDSTLSSFAPAPVFTYVSSSGDGSTTEDSVTRLTKSPTVFVSAPAFPSTLASSVSAYAPLQLEDLRGFFLGGDGCMTFVQPTLGLRYD
jgi:hypothetical protein